MKDPRRYVITDAGEKQYITDADIKTERYCDACEQVLGEEFIQLTMLGGRTGKPDSIPFDANSLMLHEHCTPPMALDLMVSSSPAAEAV